MRVEERRGEEFLLVAKEGKGGGEGVGLSWVVMSCKRKGFRRDFVVNRLVTLVLSLIRVETYKNRSR